MTIDFKYAYWTAPIVRFRMCPKCFCAMDETPIGWFCTDCEVHIAYAD